MLNEECSAILLNKLSPMLKDLESFSIPCKIRNYQFDYVILEQVLTSCLCLFLESLDWEKQHQQVSLQLADRSVKYPRGVIEDILVKVDKLYLPADFIILDMEEDKEVPIILGSTFFSYW